MQSSENGQAVHLSKSNTWLRKWARPWASAKTQISNDSNRPTILWQDSQDETDKKHLQALPETATPSKWHKNFALYLNFSAVETQNHKKLLWQSSLGSKIILILTDLFTMPSGQKNGIWMERAKTAYFSDITELSFVIPIYM